MLRRFRFAVVKHVVVCGPGKLLLIDSGLSGPVYDGHSGPICR